MFGPTLLPGPLGKDRGRARAEAELKTTKIILIVR